MNNKAAFLLSFLVLSAPVFGGYYQCENEWGRKIFSDKPCGKDAKELTIEKPVQYQLHHKDDKWDSISSSNKVREYEREIERKKR